MIACLACQHVYQILDNYREEGSESLLTKTVGKKGGETREEMTTA